MPNEYNSNAHLIELCNYVLRPTRCKEIATNGPSKLYKSRIIEIANVLCGGENCSNLLVLQSALEFLSKYYQDDLVLRSKIVRFQLRQSHGKTVLNENWAGNSRFDLGFIGQKFEIIEIKSKHDSLKRLEYQIDEFLKVTPLVSVAVGTKEQALQVEADFKSVGLYMIGPRGGVRKIRSPREDWHHFESMELLQLADANTVTGMMEQLSIDDGELHPELQRLLLCNSKIPNPELLKAFVNVNSGKQKTTWGRLQFEVPSWLWFWTTPHRLNNNQAHRVTDWMNQVVFPGIENETI